MFPLIDKKKTGLTYQTRINLYALSSLLQVLVEAMLCGNRPKIFTGENKAKIKRLYIYYKKLNKIRAA